MTLKQKYEEAKPIATFSLCNFGGLAILDIIHGIDDYAVACFNYGNGNKEIRRHKILTSPSGRPYIRKGGTRYYFDQMI